MGSFPETCNKHLMTGSKEKNINFVPEAELSETLRFEGNKLNCFPRDQSLSDLLYSP